MINTKEGNRPLTVNDRSLFAYVPQGNFLFSGTIYENLTFFAEMEEESKKLLRSSDAHYLENIREREFYLDLEENSARALVGYLKGNINE